MLTLRPAGERGHANHGWLDTWHTFSFSSYHDPAHMGFRSLRVINQDVVEPANGFGTHGHRDMEIITWVLRGALEHRDSMGSKSVMEPGDVQVMSAGTGVMHSEYNHSKTEAVELIQIWIEPARRGVKPSYAERHVAPAERSGRLAILASGDGRDGSLRIHQDAVVATALLAPGQAARHALAPGRHAWIQVARGSIDVNGTRLEPGDGAAISDERDVAIAGVADAEILLFDLA